ncbi:MAG: IS21 family transposase [Gammaproteobacteria bacterium]|nr:IS21 family transposase [Gammaproteobacteria bacterium]
MVKIKTILRLYYLGGVTRSRLIARAVDCGRTAVQECLRRAKVSGLTDWAAIDALDEEALEARLYPKSPGGPVKGTRRPLPDWARVREELARGDHQVTLALLWQEYKSEHPDGLQYSQFVCRYRKFEQKLSVVMRQHHRPGEKVFVDFCDGIRLTDPVTGAKIPTELFVGALGASSYTFARATISQAMPEWLDCHVRMYEDFHGVTAITVCDNLRSGIQRPDRYEAEVNESYQELARHYGTCVIAARVKKPRDKAKAEVAVLVAQRWILAALRHRTFYHLAELNEAIAPLLDKLNARVMRHVNASRRDLYERLDKPALRPLPETPYEYAQWRCVRLNIDYHAQFEDHYYSAPHALVKESLWVRATQDTVELYHKGKRVASHPRSFIKYAYSTVPEHRPASHRAYLEWTPSRLIAWGRSIGPATGALIDYVITHKPHPEQGYRSALGILRLSKTFGAERLERAADKALAINSPSYKTVKTMLKQRMEEAPMAASTESPKLGRANVRGRDYYH